MLVKIKPSLFQIVFLEVTEGISKNVTICCLKYLLIRDGDKVGVRLLLYHLKQVPSWKLPVKRKALCLTLLRIITF